MDSNEAVLARNTLLYSTSSDSPLEGDGGAAEGSQSYSICLQVLDDIRDCLPLSMTKIVARALAGATP